MNKMKSIPRIWALEKPIGDNPHLHFCSTTEGFRWSGPEPLPFNSFSVNNKPATSLQLDLLTDKHNVLIGFIGVQNNELAMLSKPMVQTEKYSSRSIKQELLQLKTQCNENKGRNVQT